MENPELLAAKEPILSEEHIFLDKVLCDGRYLDDFQREPEEIALLLCTPISPTVAEEVSNTPRNQLLPKLYEAKFASQRPNRPSAVSFSFAIGIVLVIGGIVIVVDSVITRRRPGAFVNDYSPHRDDKL